MRRIAVTLLGLASIPSLTIGCGLDWTLPTNHFDGVEEHGYVSYWEKIGEADLGDGLVIPVNINFNSHREASSPYLGKGWMVALLEAHVEPLDENNMKVIMPDGWNFYFQRDGNTETWHGNAGWKGETNNTVFTITAPCGWRIKFDGGKIQEIDSNKNRVLTYKYNGPVAAEVDIDGKSFVRVDNNSTSGAAQDLVIGDQKIDIALAQRPRVTAKLTQNLVTGFDPSLSQLQWPDGKKECFTFGTTDNLTPSLTIMNTGLSRTTYTWSANARIIMTSGCWNYLASTLDDCKGCVGLRRQSANGYIQAFENDPSDGKVSVTEGSSTTITYRFVNAGSLSGKLKDVVRFLNGKEIQSTHYSYSEKGYLIRTFSSDGESCSFDYDTSGMLAMIRRNRSVLWEAQPHG